LQPFGIVFCTLFLIYVRNRSFNAKLIDMKTTNTFGISFYLRRYKSKEGKAPIYVRITVDAKRTDLALKTDIEIGKWNNLKGVAKGKSDEIRSINDYLGKVRSRQKFRLKKIKSRKIFQIRNADLRHTNRFIRKKRESVRSQIQVFDLFANGFIQICYHRK